MQNIELPAGEDAVLLLHGLASSPAELRYLGKALQDKGFSVSIPHLAGYGHGGAATAWRAWQAEAGAALDKLESRYRSVSVGGLCIGAVLALSLAAEKQGGIAALSLLSTTMFYDGWSIPWYRFLLPLARRTPLRHLYAYREREPYGVKNEILRRRIARSMERGFSDAGAPRISLRHIHEASRLIGHVRRAVRDVRTPALIMHAIDDDTASVRSANFVAERIGARDVRTVFLDNSYHLVTMDNERAVVARETAEFFREKARDAIPRSGHSDLQLAVAW
jgi:carboxylesterase